jgi:uncharacterized protein YhaN
VAEAQLAVREARSEWTTADDEATKLREEATKVRTQAQVRGRGLRSVADAETDLTAAQQELGRLEELDAVLAHTTRFLEAAQERVHRDIAPRLSASIEGRLAVVTQDRYTRVRIDPQTLRVQVAPATGDFVDAEKLSFGTVEQIYLLVRIALAEMLGNPDEPCPLLLDDVTVHADRVRTTRILETLLTLAEQRQIIMFSQEQEVLDWAEATLAASREHTVIRLTAVGSSASATPQPSQ